MEARDGRLHKAPDRALREVRHDAGAGCRLVPRSARIASSTAVVVARGERCGRTAEDPLSPPPREPAGATWEAPHPIVTPPAGPSGPSGPSGVHHGTVGPAEPRRPRPGRGALIGALAVVVTLVLGTGVVVGVRFWPTTTRRARARRGERDGNGARGDGRGARPRHRCTAPSSSGSARRPRSRRPVTSGASWWTAGGVEFDVPAGAYTSDLTFAR